MPGRPRIFLSHSKKDRLFIERLASELQFALVDVWYDDWEIPPGDSLRKRIFSEGIPESDLFFIYITENSLASYWCERELDAAFVHEVDQRGGNLAIFADSDGSRLRLPPDLRSLRVPLLDQSNYERGVRLIVSNGWRAFAKRQVLESQEKLQLRLAETQRTLAEVRLQLERAHSAGGYDETVILAALEKRTFSHGSITKNLREIFLFIVNDLAAGAIEGALGLRVSTLFGLDHSYNKGVGTETSFSVADVLGPFIVQGLVDVKPPSGEWSELLYLSDLGKRVARTLELP